MVGHVGKQFGDYRLIRILGHGGFGDVYLGEHVKDHTKVAIKVSHANRKDWTDYFNEIRPLVRLRHPNIVPLIDLDIEKDVLFPDLGINKDVPFLVMPYTPNGTLRQPRGTRLPLDTIVNYVKQIAEALQCAHDKRIIHRDVKPENILLGPNFEIWLSDFGIAGVAHSTNSNNQGNAGTYAYMAPEQKHGKPREASDQYSLGVMTYEWICGDRPLLFVESQPSLRESVPNLPVTFEEVVMKALEEDPKKRFPNVRAFATALEQAWLSTSSPPVSPKAELLETVQLMVEPEPIMRSDPEVESFIAPEPADNGNKKKGLPLFGDKSKLVPNVGEPGPLEDLDDLRPPQPVPAPILPVPAASESAPESSFSRRDPSSHVAHTVEDASAKPASPQPRHDPGIIPLPFTLPAAQPGPISGKLPATPATNGPGSNASAPPPASSRATAPATPVPVPIPVPPPDGAQPPSRGNIGGADDGNQHRPSRRPTRRRLAVMLALLLAGIAFVSLVGQGLIGHITGSTTTATVTITPDHQPVSVSLVIVAVTGKPVPTAQQVQATILSYTTPTPQSASANATGSIQGANATGTLTFINTGSSGITINGGILTGASGVSVSFNGPLFIPVGSASVVGTAVNAGVGGDIPRFDISATCCGSSNILVRNTTAFAGGRDPVPNSVITQNDINSATNKLISNTTATAQAALQQKVQSGEQVVSNSLKCTPNVTPNHRVGDQATSVTVTGTVVTCTEEVYDRVAAQQILMDALKAEALKNLGAGFDLVGNVVSTVTSTSVDARNTVTLDIAATGEWVYHFTDTTLNALKTKIAKESKSLALADVKKVSNVDISISDGGDTMPDAGSITIKIVPIPGLSGSPTPGSGSPTTTPGTTPTSSPTLTTTPGLGCGPPATPTVLGGS